LTIKLVPCIPEIYVFLGFLSFLSSTTPSIPCIKFWEMSLRDENKLPTAALSSGHNVNAAGVADAADVEAADAVVMLFLEKSPQEVRPGLHVLAGVVPAGVVPAGIVVPAARIVPADAAPIKHLIKHYQYISPALFIIHMMSRNKQDIKHNIMNTYI
jgi:hypothetical protein